MPGGKIFGWEGTFLDYLGYGYFDAEGDSYIWYDLEPKEDDQSRIDRTMAFAFSQRSKQMAYAVRNPVHAYNIENDEVKLWISDIELKDPELVWFDKEKWLGEVDPIDLGIRWGIEDRYVLVMHGFIENRLAIYDTQTKTVEKWEGNCNLLAKSPVSDRLAIWCRDEGDSPQNTYLVLEKDGMTRTQEEPIIISKVIDWAYSPDGKRVLYSTDDLRMRVTDEKGHTTDISAEYSSDESWEINSRQNLQWSQDGKKILVYGHGIPRDLCPQWDPTLRAKYGDRPCWLVLDANTGKVIWKPEQVKTPPDIPWEKIDIGLGATLSQDGEYIAMILLGSSPARARDVNIFLAPLEGENAIIRPTTVEPRYMLWQTK